MIDASDSEIGIGVMRETLTKGMEAAYINRASR